MKRSPRDTLSLTVLCLIGYFFVGCQATLVPSLMPAILRGFHLNLAEVGLIFPANAVGSLLGGLLAGMRSDRAGRKPFFCGGALLSCLALVAAYRVAQWPLFVVSFLLTGMAQGALGNSINALTIDLHAQNRGRALNALHGLYSLGAMVGPVALKFALDTALPWRAAFLGMAALWLTFGLCALAFRYPAAHAAKEEPRGIQFALLIQPLFALLFLVAFCYNGVAWALLNWIKEFLQQRGARPEFASSMLSLFYLGLTLGRFACASLTERLGYGRTLLLCAAGATLAYPLTIFSPLPTQIALGVAMSGLFLSGLYPTALAYATRLFPGRLGTVAGTMAVAMTLGAAFPAWCIGVIGSLWGLGLALRINYGMLLPLLGIGLYFALRDTKTPASRADDP